MKKLLALLMACLMVFSLAACGGDKAKDGADKASGETGAANDGSSFGIDFTSEEVQPMGEEKADVAVLKKTAEEYLEGNTMFSYSNDKRTYADFVEYIGCDANEYQFSSRDNARMYTWKAADSDTAWFAAYFFEKDGAWVLYASSSSNLDLEVNK